MNETAEPTFSHGARVMVRHTYGLTNPEWRTGIITEMFVAPITGTWVYVVAGNGYYENEIRQVDTEELRADLGIAS